MDQALICELPDGCNMELAQFFEAVEMSNVEVVVMMYINAGVLFVVELFEAVAIQDGDVFGTKAFAVALEMFFVAPCWFFAAS